MSHKAVKLAMQTPLDPTCKLVLLAYAYHANHATHLAWPGQELLEQETGLTERSIRNWVGWLKDPAHQILIPAGSVNRSRRYRINMALLEQMAVIKAESDAEIDDEKAEPGAGNEKIPELDSGILNEIPESSSKKPESSSIKDEIPESSSKKPESPAPKQEEQEVKENLTGTSSESAAPVDEAGALRIFTDITGMVAFPGGADSAGEITGKICNLAAVHHAELPTYLKPYWLAQMSTKTRNGQSYQKTWSYWLDWAIANELPDYVTQQLRHKFKSLPPDLVSWMLARDQAKAGIAPPGANGNGSKSLAGYTEETRKEAERLGLVKPRKGNT